MSAVPPAHRGPLGPIDGVMPEFAARVDGNPLLAFIDSCLRGVGQVVFMNNPLTGLLIIVPAWIFEPWVGFGGTLGLVVSTVTGMVLGVDRSLVRNGLYGFNGVLVGLALATFLAPEWDVNAILWIVAVSIISSILMATLATVFLGAWKVPPFTLPFNFATLIFLVAALGFARGQLGPGIAPGQPQVLGEGVETTLREAAGAASANDVEGVLNAIFRGIGQLFFVDDPWLGVVMIVGIAICSRIAAIFAVAGSILGMLTGLALGAGGVAIYHGLWGFNSFDACLAIGGVFYVLTWRSGLFAAGCAIFTALLFGAIAMFFVPWGLPALTLPFCFGTLAFVIMKYTSTQFVPVEVEEITTPEEHRQRYRDGTLAATTRIASSV